MKKTNLLFNQHPHMLKPTNPKLKVKTQTMFKTIMPKAPTLSKKHSLPSNIRVIRALKLKLKKFRTDLFAFLPRKAVNYPRFIICV